MCGFLADSALASALASAWNPVFTPHAPSLCTVGRPLIGRRLLRETGTTSAAKDGTLGPPPPRPPVGNLCSPELSLLTCEVGILTRVPRVAKEDYMDISLNSAGHVGSAQSTYDVSTYLSCGIMATYSRVYLLGRL